MKKELTLRGSTRPSMRERCEGQGAGGGVGMVPRLAHDLKHPLPDYVPHVRVLVDHPRDGGAGHPCLSGDIFQCQSWHLLTPLVVVGACNTSTQNIAKRVGIIVKRRIPRANSGSAPTV